MTTVLADALASAEAELRNAGIRDPRRDAEVIVAHALGLRRHELPPSLELGSRHDQFAQMIRRRAQRVPLEHLIGRVQFRNVELYVGPGVFVPQPETESVVQWAVDALVAQRLTAPTIVDLCTGAGTIALGHGQRGARITGLRGGTGRRRGSLDTSQCHPTFP